MKYLSDYASYGGGLVSAYNLYQQFKNPQGSYAAVKAATKRVLSTRLRRPLAGRVVEMRKRRNELYVPAADYTKASVHLGRKSRQNLRQAWKRIKANTTQTVYRMNDYSQFGGASGAVQLLNTSTTLTTGNHLVPCHLYDITGVINNVNGVNVANSIRWDPAFTLPTDAGVLFWTNTKSITLESADQTAATFDNYPRGKDLLDWYSARLLFYNATTIPCKFLVQIVQFTDERLVPGATVTQFSTAFWQAMVKKYTWTPLEVGDVNYAKYLKVWHTSAWSMDPKESIDASSTKYRELNIFRRFNRMCNYDWVADDKMGTLTNNEGQVNAGDVDTTVHPRARLFLMIRAVSRNGTAYSSTIHPSYDILHRTAHSNI